MVEIAKPEIPEFQLYLVASAADFHTQQEGNELNRSNVTDESTNKFTIQASLEKVIHGEGSNLNSFIGLHFRMKGANDKRRFKSVTITIRFEDEAKPLEEDPEVIKIWPDTDYFWQGMSKEIEDTKSVETSVKGSAPGGAGELGVVGKWQRQEKFVRNTPARLSGEKTLLKRRAGSHKNAMIIRMSENVQEKSGILRELRAGILIERKREGRHRFKMHLSISADADMRFDVVRGLKKLVGSNHVTDPVIFEPGTNFLDADDVGDINNDVVGPGMVGKYGEAASSTELANVSKKVKKEDGEWKEVAAEDPPPAKPADTEDLPVEAAAVEHPSPAKPAKVAAVSQPAELSQLLAPSPSNDKFHWIAYLIIILLAIIIIIK
jgi:hypothetical protein